MTCMVSGHEFALWNSFRSSCELDLHHIALGCTIVLLSLGYLKLCIASSLARLTWKRFACKRGAKYQFKTATVFSNKFQKLHVDEKYKSKLQRQSNITTQLNCGMSQQVVMAETDVQFFLLKI